MKIFMIVFLSISIISNVNAKNKDNCSPFYLFDCNYYDSLMLHSALGNNWSSNWKCFNDNIRDANTDIEDYWQNEIKPIIEDIKEESESRKKKLETIKRLEKERLLVHKEIEFLLQQESELLSNQADLESTRRIAE